MCVHNALISYGVRYVCLGPSIPGLVSSLQVTDASLMLPVTWNPPLNLTQSGDIIVYEVEFWDEEEGQEGGRIVNVTATSVELTGLRPESTYTISVRAYTTAGPGGERILTVTPTTAITCELVETCGFTLLIIRNWKHLELRLLLNIRDTLTSGFIHIVANA